MRTLLYTLAVVWALSVPVVFALFWRATRPTPDLDPEPPTLDDTPTPATTIPLETPPENTLENTPREADTPLQRLAYLDDVPVWVEYEPTRQGLPLHKSCPCGLWELHTDSVVTAALGLAPCCGRAVEIGEVPQHAWEVIAVELDRRVLGGAA